MAPSGETPGRSGGQATAAGGDELVLPRLDVGEEPCLEHALEHRIDHGVWGGSSERERRRILRSRRLAAAAEPAAATA